MNGLLTESVVNQFDYSKIKNTIIDFISGIELLSFKLSNMERPKITSNYEIKYSSSSLMNTNSKVEKFVVSKIFLEEQIHFFLSKYASAINSLNDIERKVFIKSYIYGTRDDVISYEEGLNANKLLQVKKSSSIKFYTILDLENLMLN